jgi:hypothetical protein
MNRLTNRDLLRMRYESNPERIARHDLVTGDARQWTGRRGAGLKAKWHS